MNNYKRNSEVWLQQVQKELGGKAMGELEFPLDKELIIDPIRSYLYDAKPSERVEGLPQTTNLSYLEINNKSDNELLLTELNGGANGLYLAFKPDFELAKLGDLLNGVLGGIINTVFDIDNCDFSKEEFENELESLGFVTWNYIIVDGKIEAVLNFSAGFIVTEIYDLLKNILSHKIELPSLVSIKSSERFFVNISAIRALRALLLNLDLAEMPKLLAINEPDGDSVDFNQSLIAHTSVALSSTIAGADFLVSKAQKNDPQQLRLLRNIPNLLQLESGLNEHYDAVEGARNLNFMIDKICEEVWEKLKEE